MAVLITGGYGHIGSWAAYLLARKGRQVIVMDVNPTAPDHLRGLEGQITFVRGSVTDFPRLVEIFRKYDGQIEGIIHTVGVMAEFVLDNPQANVSLNVGGTVNLLEIARLFAVPKVVYTSTGAVYGPVSGVVTEDVPPNPPDLYAATKISSEYIGRRYAAQFGFDFRTVRVYMCYGPGRLPSQFIRLYRIAFGALEGLKGLGLDKGADQKLDFTYIEDAALGVVLLFEADKPAHDVYNIATGQAASVGRVIELAQQYAPEPVEVKLGPGKIMDRCEALNIDRARAELGYEPGCDLETGIAKYAAWLKKVK